MFSLKAHCSDSLWNLFRQEITEIVCLSDCPADQDIWGTDVYDNPSKTCLAARHSGQLTSKLCRSVKEKIDIHSDCYVVKCGRAQIYFIFGSMLA